MNVPMTIHYTDGSTAEGVARPVTQVAFERQFKIAFSEVSNMEHIYWIGWHAVGKPTTFDQWLGTIDSVDMDDDEEQEDDARPLDETLSSGD